MFEKEQIQDFLTELTESIEFQDGSLNLDTKIDSIDWDSLAVISCIALADEKFNVMLSGDELAKITTIGDIFQLISKKK
tara:strand:+ start:217 stop:453 length:237 start_codon:yes stop_codon:yes gene_type:complete